MMIYIKFHIKVKYRCYKFSICLKLTFAINLYFEAYMYVIDNKVLAQNNFICGCFIYMIGITFRL